jgi:peptide deformylase
MSVQKILLYPHPILKKLCRQVAAIDPEISGLIEDLVDTMRAGPGSVGVAAPQIGVSLRVCVVDVSASRLGKENHHGLLAMVNPEIVASAGAAVMREGCMSIPDYTGDVERATTVTVRFTDEAGNAREI